MCLCCYLVVPRWYARMRAKGKRRILSKIRQTERRNETPNRVTKSRIQLAINESTVRALKVKESKKKKSQKKGIYGKTDPF